MVGLEQYEQFKKGVGHWNEWRKEHPDDIIDLSGLKIEGDYSNVNLAGANLYGCDMSGSHLEHAHFENATLSMANLTGAHLIGVHLQGAELIATNLSLADLSGAHLENATMPMANLTKANLLLAHLQGANLRGARLINARLVESDITGTDFSYAYLGNTNVARVKYSRSKMDGKFQGVRVDSCYGNAIFKRDAQDQDYIDTLWVSARTKWDEPIHRDNGIHSYFAFARRKINAFSRFTWLSGWGFFSDYGRSIPRIILVAWAIIYGFGKYYQMHPHLLSYGTHKATAFSPYYYSTVIFATPGFGDVSANGVLGEKLVVFEVLLGYVTLGLLLSILGNKVARRS